MDLSKEIMMDLGITVIGDIIAILKHAKLVYRQVRTHCIVLVIVVLLLILAISVVYGEWVNLVIVIALNLVL